MHARPQTVTAAVLQVLLGLANLASPLFPLEGVSVFVVYLGVVLGIAGMVTSAGLWMLRKWSIWPTPSSFRCLTFSRRLRGWLLHLTSPFKSLQQ